KHRGLTFFFLPMRQPGVEVRPLRQITGEQHFNEVFITDARMPDANRLGDPGDGWRVLQTALAYERALMGVADRAPGRARAGRSAAPVDPVWEASTNLVALARALGRSDDPVIRQQIARVYSLRVVNAWNGQRATAALKQGTSSPLVSLGKLAMSRIVHESARVEAAVVATDALLVGDENPHGEAAS